MSGDTWAVDRKDTREGRRVISRSLAVRLTMAITVLLFWLWMGAFALAALPSPYDVFAALAGLSLSVFTFVRGLRLSLVADTNEIVVCNLIRTYRLRWEEVSDVGIGGSLSDAVAIRLRGTNRIVTVQATSSGTRECRRVISELALLRPDLPIRFLTD